MVRTVGVCCLAVWVPWAAAGKVSLTGRAFPPKVEEGRDFTVELVLRWEGGGAPFESPVLSEVRNGRIKAVMVEDREATNALVRRYVYTVEAGKKGVAVFGTVAVRYRDGGREDFLVSPEFSVDVMARRRRVAGMPFLVFLGVSVASIGLAVGAVMGSRRSKAREGGPAEKAGAREDGDRDGLASLPLEERYAGYLRLLEASLRERLAGRPMPADEEAWAEVLGEEGRAVAKVFGVASAVRYAGRRISDEDVDEVRRLLAKVSGRGRA